MRRLRVWRPGRVSVSPLGTNIVHIQRLSLSGLGESQFWPDDCKISPCDRWPAPSLHRSLLLPTTYGGVAEKN